MATEIDKLDPIPDFVILKSGLRVQLESLKARQFFKLLRIVTHGALPAVRDGGLLDMEGLDAEEFLGRLMSVLLLSIPDAEDETIEFVRSMCFPAGLAEGVGRRGLNKQDVEHNTMLWEALDLELENPELDDLVTIIEAVIKREAEDIQALGKRLASMFKLAEKTGQIPASPNPQTPTPASLEDYPGRSTSSPRNTTGRTTKSRNRRSVESVNTSLLSENNSTTPVSSVSNG